MKKVFSLLFFISLCLSVFSQVTTSSISGKSAPHASITLIYNPTSVSYTVLSDDKGIFRVYNAIVGGPYTIKASSSGYKAYQKEEFYFSLGSNDLDIQLIEDVKSLETVKIVGSKSVIKNGSGLLINEERLKTTPSINRSITDFTKLVPQSINNSFAGTNFRYNNVTIDGTINNDAIGFSPSLGGQAGTSGMPGSSTRTSSISADAIKDIQVYVAPFDVKIGNFLGGSINAVTRSGTNKVEGSIYSFGRDLHDIKSFQGGFRLGFPIIKNKLFFFTSQEATHRVDPILYGGNTKGLINDSLAKTISEYTLARYEYNVGAYDNYSIYSDSKKFFNRLDWNISKKNQLTIRNNTVFSAATNLERDAANFRFGSMDFRQNNNQNSTVLELKSQFIKASNSFILGYTNIHDYRTPLSERASFPQTEIAYNGGTIFLGNEREATVFNLKQKTYEITDNLSWSLGKHSLLIGTHNEFYNIGYGFVNSWNGRISYKSVSDYLAEKVNRVRGFYGFNTNDRDSLFNNPYANFNINLLSAYAQDEISLGKVKVSPGIRFDYTDLPIKPTLSSQAPKKYANDYFNNLNVSPRLGFSYKNKSLTIRGGSGVFVGRIPFAWLGYAYYNDGIGFGSFDLNNRASLKNVGNPIVDGAKTFAFNNGQKNLVQIDLIDNKFKMPKVWRSNLAVDKTIAGYKLTLEGIYTEVLTDLKFQQINIVTDNPTYYSFDTKHEMPIYSGNKVNSNISNAYLLSNTDKGYRYQLTAMVNKKYKWNLDLYAAYTYGVSKDLTNGIRNSMESNWQLNQSLTPNDPKLAYSNFDIRHRIVSQITYRIKKTQVGIVINSQSGVPFTWGLVNGTLQNNPQSAGLVYIFKDNEVGNYILNKDQAKAFTGFVNSDNYLSTRKGMFTERNGGRTPWSTTVDIKVMRTVGKRWQISADIFNAFSGKTYFISNTFNSTSSVGLTKISGETFSFVKPTQNPYSIDKINSKWQAQIGLRYNF